MRIYFNFNRLTAFFVLLSFAFFYFGIRDAYSQINGKSTSSSPAPVLRHAVGSSTESSRQHSAQFGIGFSTITQAMTGGNDTSITGTIDFLPMETIQVFLGIPQTTTGFGIGGGALFKRTLAGSHETGFHIGGGMGLAVINTVFRMNFSLIAGVHFSLPGLPQIRVHLDGGPSITVNASSPTTSNFQLSSLSSALGASVVYIF